MGTDIKSGQKVIEEFMAGLIHLENVDEQVLQLFIALVDQGKLTDTNLHNALDNMLTEHSKEE